MKNILFNLSKHLGFMNPYFIKENEKFNIKKNINSLLKLNKQHNIDPVAILEIINKGFCFSDRTLIQDVYMTPWMAKPNSKLNKWHYAKIPSHKNIEKDSKIIAKELYEKLKIEIISYIGDKENIGILLSGGMDSRVVATILNDLIIDGFKLNVTAITWGIKDSRDVIYAQKISKILQWKWKYFELNSDTLVKNIEIAAKEGALYSPIHLHAMYEVSNLKNIDCIIAGSFGDSVGRAEYSGIHVSNLSTLSNSIFNRFKIIKSSIYNEYKEDVTNDIEYYNNIFPKDKLYQRYEVEQELHYMRKLLNPCMNLINKKIPLFHAFSSPSVFGYMWSLSPKVRTDQIYYNLLKLYSSNLLNIPWARTGSKYLDNQKSKPDTLLKNYHKYGIWIRKDLYPILKEKVLSKEIEDLNIFNMKSIERLFFINSFSKQIKNTKIDEILIWLATLSDFVRNNNIIGVNPISTTLKDKFDGNIISIVHYIAFNLKVKINKASKNEKYNFNRLKWYKTLPSNKKYK